MPTARRAPLALVVGLVLALVAGCAGGGEPTRRLEPSDAVRYDTGLTYFSDPKTATTLRADACLPPGGDGTAPRKAVLVLHGGAFTEGSRDSSGMRALCTLLARFGVVAVSVDYRLAPRFRYPAQVEDVGRAVAWLRAPAQADRFGIDPAHVGVVGSSAGAILAQSVGTRGTGRRDAGQRVSAVVSLSGVSAMTPDALALGRPGREATALIATYLGCESVRERCPQAEPASAVTAVDRTDPPMLLVTGSDEIVPVEQAQTMAAALTKAKVPVQQVVVPGDRHGLALLDADVRRALRAFLDRHL